MLLNNIYYSVKPFIPRSLQIFVRRKIVARKLRFCAGVWPIDEKAGAPPEGWKGWPEGKKFALVLTHDVETEKGLNNCRQLADLEMRLGFRSSFNFVPEKYSVPTELRHYLTENGFEVGVHDLKHDGKLFRSEKMFNSRVSRINKYISDWGAKGFRSGAMLGNLNWMHGLNIRYDMSTFDTDPFEPRSRGAGTIFPFRVTNGSEDGYIELPYTLPQDFTLFILMKEQNIEIWKRKLDWIVEKGGMSLVAVHPDYISFNGKLGREECSAEHYTGLLEYIKNKYKGGYWNGLPREVAEFWEGLSKSELITARESKMSAIRNRREGKSLKSKKIWIDLDNSPHVPFFKPIIRELHRRGYSTIVTARDCFQVCGLAERHKVEYRKIGRHYGKNKALKAIGLLFRALQMAWPLYKEKPDLALSHGSRSQTILASFLGVPSVVILDYEYAQFLPIFRPDWVIAPDIIPNNSIRIGSDRILRYQGIKENVYLGGFRPEPTLRTQLGVDHHGLLVTIRPPANEAHYHNPESEMLFHESIEFIGQTDNVVMAILPRNKRQENMIRQKWPELIRTRKIVIPDQVVDGLNLIWNSDLVISGGGTMNREAAALGVPVYSIFRGTIGAVDRYLSDKGRLTFLKSVEDVNNRIILARNQRSNASVLSHDGALHSVVNSIISILEIRSHDFRSYGTKS